MQRKAIVIGATGLVGQELIKQLASLYDRVIVLSRRPPEQITESMLVYQVNDFSSLADSLANVDIDSDMDAFSCLGTTKKDAGGEDGFRLVDYEYNLEFAQICRNKGVNRFFLLSSKGADIRSRFFYNRVKGELEKSISDLEFESFYVFRPSLLLGKHKGRPVENISQKIFKVISPILSERIDAHPISAKRVAISIAMTAHQCYQDYKYRSHDCTVKTTIIENKTMLSMTNRKH